MQKWPLHTVAHWCTLVHNAAIVYSAQKTSCMSTEVINVHVSLFCFFTLNHILYLSLRCQGEPVLCLAALVVVGKKHWNKILWNWHYYSDRLPHYISKTTAMTGPTNFPTDLSIPLWVHHYIWWQMIRHNFICFSLMYGSEVEQPPRYGKGMCHCGKSNHINF